MSLVVRTPDVYHMVEIALEKLVVVIRYIGGEIGRYAITPYQHLVLLVPQQR